MKASNRYRLEKLGMYYHILRLHYVGWWIFSKRIWLSEVPFYWDRNDAIKKYKELTKKI